MATAFEKLKEKVATTNPTQSTGIVSVNSSVSEKPTSAFEALKQKVAIPTDQSVITSTPTTPSTSSSGVGNFVKNLVRSPLTLLARPFQAAAGLAGADLNDIDKTTQKYFGDLVAPVPQNANDLSKDFGRAAQTVALGLGPVSGGAIFGAGNSLEEGNDLFSTQTALQSALGAGAGKVLDLVGKPLLDASGKVLGKITPEIIQDIVGKGTQAIEKFAASHNIFPEATSKVINAGAQALEDVANKPFQAAGKVIGDTTRAILPKSENIMNRVARLTPSDAAKFEKMTGQSHGEYLTKTGNFGNPQQVVDNEYNKFVASKKAADDAIATLPGNYQHDSVKTALDELVTRENRIGVEGGDSSRIKMLAQKYQREGLNMSEINEVKRLYERNVKLDYLKSNIPEGVEKANRIDDSIRQWQFKQADRLGLKNLPALNKQTQASKFLVDKLGKQIVGKTGNEAISITDWIVLSGGDPKALAGFAAKKFFGSKTVQAGIAKLLSKEPGALPIVAEFGGKTGLPALIPGQDYGTTIQMGGPKPSTSFEAPAQKINRTSSLPEQLRLPAPTSNAQGTPIRLPQSVRETNLGLNEVRNTIRAKPIESPILGKEGIQPSPIKLPPTIEKSSLPSKPVKIGSTKTIKELTDKILSYANIHPVLAEDIADKAIFLFKEGGLTKTEINDWITKRVNELLK